MNPQISFADLPLSEAMQKAIAEMGFTHPSPIQTQAIPVALEGQDVLGMAQTGTGKTAAFGIPSIEQIDGTKKYTQVLVLCPTRELAVQVTEEFGRLSKYKSIRCAAVYGGDSIEKQIRVLKEGAQVVVGTPGRIIDHLERKTLKLDHIKVVVLDEADEMLDMGFREDIEIILDQLPDERQTLLFSATMSKHIMSLTQRFQRNPQLIKVVRNEVTAENIEQLFYEIKPNAKVEVMTRLIDVYNLQLMLVFCNTKKKVEEVTEALIVRGYQAEGLHGDMRQQQRNQIMAKFKSSVINMLVATDVAARGIDVSGVDAVFNFDIPLDPEYYVHRIGRTGRAGNSGKAFTFVVGREFMRVREIEQYIKTKLKRGVVPSFEDVVGVKKAKFIERIKNTIDEGDLDVFSDMLPLLTHEGLSEEDIIKALIKMTMGVQKSEYGDVDLSSSGSSFKDREKESKSQGKRERDRLPKKRSSSSMDTTRLFVNVGKIDKVRPNDIVGALTSQTGVEYNLIGQIDIYDKFSFVEVAKEEAQRVLIGMKNKTIKNKPVILEHAK